jgi:two-component system sensor histidine kinase KdpD
MRIAALSSAGTGARAGRVQRWVIAFVALFALTGAMLLVRSDLEKAHVALLFLLVVLFGSSIDGSALGLTLAGAAFLLFDFFFLPPYNTLGLTNPVDWLVLVSFLVTSIVAAQLLAQAQRRTQEARARTLEVERFSTLGAETLNAGEPVEGLAAIAEVIRATLAVDSCDIYVHRGKDADLELLAHASAPKVAGAASTVARAGGLLAWVGGRKEIAVERQDGTVTVGTAAEDASADARSVTQAGWFLSWGDIADARAIAIPLTVRGRSVGVLRVAKEPHVDLAPGQRDFLNALSYYAALGVERVQLAADASHTAALRDRDRLKNALLAAVSHDLRTPLTTVKALAHTIVERGAGPNDSNAISIEEEADRLTSLITDLLDYSRLTGGALLLAPQIESADDLIGAALARVHGIVAARSVRVTPDEAIMLLGRFDFVHSVRAVVNLIENAVKYSAPDTPIEIGVHRQGEHLVISVADRGVGVKAEDRERIFEPFYRSPSTPPAAHGAGLGLAIARGLAIAQGGDVTYEPRPGGGSGFSLLLPAVEQPAL